MKLIFISLCFCQSLFIGSGQLIKIGGIAVNVVKFGLDIVKLVEDKKSPPDNDAVAKLKEHISTCTREIKTSIGLSSKLEHIDDAVINIHSSLIDIGNIVESNTLTERDQYIRLFILRFEEHGVIKHLRFLPELLTYTIPGASGKLIDLVANYNRCNMTALHAFKFDGISIHLLYLHLRTELPMNNTIKEWTVSLENVSHVFDNQEASCMKNFPKLAEEDVNTATDATRLWLDNKQRYSWKTSDVIFLKPYGTHQFLYLKYKANHLFWQKTSARNKIAVFNDVKENVMKPEILVNASETIKSSIEGETDEKAALHVGQAIEEHLKDQNFSINAIVVFFDGGDFSAEKIKIDGEASVIQMPLDDVKLKYCYEGFFGCDVDVLNWFGGTKEVHGKMRVFAYVNKAEQKHSDSVEKTTYKIGSSQQNLPMYLTLIFSLLFYLLSVLN